MNLDFNRNEDQNKLLLSDLRRKLEKIHEGGGKKAADKQHEKRNLLPANGSPT